MKPLIKILIALTLSLNLAFAANYSLYKLSSSVVELPYQLYSYGDLYYINSESDGYKFTVYYKKVPSVLYSSNSYDKRIVVTNKKIKVANYEAGYYDGGPGQIYDFSIEAPKLYNFSKDSSGSCSGVDICSSSLEYPEYLFDTPFGTDYYSSSCGNESPSFCSTPINETFYMSYNMYEYFSSCPASSPYYDFENDKCIACQENEKINPETGKCEPKCNADKIKSGNYSFQDVADCVCKFGNNNPCSAGLESAINSCQDSFSCNVDGVFIQSTPIVYKTDENGKTWAYYKAIMCTDDSADTYNSINSIPAPQCAKPDNNKTTPPQPPFDKPDDPNTPPPKPNEPSNPVDNPKDDIKPEPSPSPDKPDDPATPNPQPNPDKPSPNPTNPSNGGISDNNNTTPGKNGGDNTSTETNKKGDKDGNSTNGSNGSDNSSGVNLGTIEDLLSQIEKNTQKDGNGTDLSKVEDLLQGIREDLNSSKSDFNGTIDFGDPSDIDVDGGLDELGSVIDDGLSDVEHIIKKMNYKVSEDLGKAEKQFNEAMDELKRIANSIKNNKFGSIGFHSSIDSCPRSGVLEISNNYKREIIYDPCKFVFPLNTLFYVITYVSLLVFAVIGIFKIISKA